MDERVGAANRKLSNGSQIYDLQHPWYCYEHSDYRRWRLIAYLWLYNTRRTTQRSEKFTKTGPSIHGNEFSGSIKGWEMS